jgi:hypothetical protein
MVAGWDKGKQTLKSVYYNTISSSIHGLAKVFVINIHSLSFSHELSFDLAGLRSSGQANGIQF